MIFSNQGLSITQKSAVMAPGWNHFQDHNKEGRWRQIITDVTYRRYERRRSFSQSVFTYPASNQV